MLIIRQIPTPVAVAKLLLTVITCEGTDWDSLKAKVERDFCVVNWITEVRSTMDVLANNGLIARTNDVHKEVWYRRPTEPFTDSQIARLFSLPSDLEEEAAAAGLSLQQYLCKHKWNQSAAEADEGGWARGRIYCLHCGIDGDS